MRVPRRSFAAPFVIVAALPGCRVTSSSPPPRHVNPPPPSTGQTAPAPQPEPTGPDQVTVVNPPRPTGPTSPGVDGGAPNSSPSPATSKVWYITKQGATCSASLRVSCPTGEPGKPMPTCNPPPPMKYDCPTGWDGSSQLFVTQYAGSTECVIEAPATNCAPNEKCRKPAPQKVPCPKY